MALLDDLFADRGVERAADAAQQQRARIAVAEPFDRQLREPGEGVAGARARSAHECDPLGEEAAGDEREDLRGGVIEPLRVVDDAGERLLLGDLGKERQRRERHEEPVGRRPGAPSEHGREGVALRSRQPLELIQHRRAELVKAAVGELHLGLDAYGSRDAPAFGAVGHVIQQRALAHAGLASQHGDTGATGEHVGQETVECRTLGATSEERHRPPTYPFVRVHVE